MAINWTCPRFFPHKTHRVKEGYVAYWLVIHVGFGGVLFLVPAEEIRAFWPELGRAFAFLSAARFCGCKQTSSSARMSFRGVMSSVELLLRRAGKKGQMERGLAVRELDCLGHRRQDASMFAVVAAFGRWACRIANLLGRVSEERLTESDEQRLQLLTFGDRFAGTRDTRRVSWVPSNQIRVWCPAGTLPIRLSQRADLRVRIVVVVMAFPFGRDRLPVMHQPVGHGSGQRVVNVEDFAPVAEFAIRRDDDRSGFGMRRLGTSGQPLVCRREDIPAHREGDGLLGHASAKRIPKSRKRRSRPMMKISYRRRSTK